MGSKDDANLVDAQIEMGLKDHGRARTLPIGYCPACKERHPFPMHEWPDNFAVPMNGYDEVGAFGPGDHADGPQQQPDETARQGSEETS